jgi:hypothetical protein
MLIYLNFLINKPKTVVLSTIMFFFNTKIDRIMDFVIKKRQMSRKIFFPELSYLIAIQAPAGGDKPPPLQTGRRSGVYHRRNRRG